MGIKHGIGLTVRDSEDNIVRNNMYWEEDVESIGGVGAIVETVESLCREDESIEIQPMYYE